jgi:hypothetical protein
MVTLSKWSLYRTCASVELAGRYWVELRKQIQVQTQEVTEGQVVFYYRKTYTLISN